MEALHPWIHNGRLRNEHLYQTIEELRLPARYFSVLTAHLESLGIVLTAEDDIVEDESGYDRNGLSAFLEKALHHRILTAKEERDLASTIDAGRLAKEWLDSGNVPEHAISDLRRKVRAGEEASNEFVRCNFKLVVSIVKKLQRRGLDLEDLIQEGYFGLAIAVRKFDPDLGYKFSTYATWWIRQSASRAIADRGDAIRLPVHMHERVVRYVTTLRRIHGELGRLPTEAELARVLEWTPRELKEVGRASRLRPESLDKMVGDRLRAGDRVADPEVVAPEEAAITAEVCREVRSIVGELSDRERDVIELRFGLVDGRIHTLEEIGQRFGVTRERIRQIEVKALTALRSPAKRRGLRDFIDQVPNRTADMLAGDDDTASTGAGALIPVRPAVGRSA